MFDTSTFSGPISFSSSSRSCEVLFLRGWRTMLRRRYLLTIGSNGLVSVQYEHGYGCMRWIYDMSTRSFGSDSRLARSQDLVYGVQRFTRDEDPIVVGTAIARYSRTAIWYEHDQHITPRAHDLASGFATHHVSYPPVSSAMTSSLRQYDSRVNPLPAPHSGKECSRVRLR
jgi:hypothetical protein